MNRVKMFEYNVVQLPIKAWWWHNSFTLLNLAEAITYVQEKTKKTPGMHQFANQADSENICD